MSKRKWGTHCECTGNVESDLPVTPWEVHREHTGYRPGAKGELLAEHTGKRRGQMGERTSKCNRERKRNENSPRMQGELSREPTRNPSGNGTVNARGRYEGAHR